MKNTKRNVLTLILSFALIMCLALSVGLSVKPVSAATGTLTTFEVVEGAAIRRGTVDPETEEEINNGIRFASKVSITEFNALDGENTLVKVGMFIMPYDYIERFGEINEDNCFGVSAGYTWTDKETASKDGAKQIIHLKSSAFIPTLESGALADYYLIQGSVVNMKEQNLDREYVGCAYISVEKEGATTYYFAKGYAQNKRSPIDVSYNALLKSDFEDVHEIAEEYVTDYIAYYKSQNDGANPTRTINADVYLNSSTGEYVKSASKSTVKTVEIATVEDLTKDYTVEDLGLTVENCTQVKGIVADGTSTKIALDNSATVKGYYDENQVDVLFDLSLDPTASIASGSLALVNNGATVSSGFTWQWGLRSNWGWHGTRSIWVQDFYADDKYDTNIVYSTPKTLVQATNTFSMMIKFVDSNRDISSGYSIKVEITDANNTVHTTTCSVAVDATATEHTAQQVTATFPTPISSVKEIAFVGNASGTSHYLFDYICAEYLIGGGVQIGGENTTVSGSDIKVSGTAPVTFTTVKPFSTVYNSEEFANCEVSVSAKQFVHGDSKKAGATGETTALTVTESGYSLSAIDNYYTVSTEFSYTLNGEEQTTTNTYMVWGYHNNVIQNFDTDITAGNNPIATPTNDGNIIWQLGGATSGVDGGYSADCRFGYGRTWSINCANIENFKITGTCNKVCFWVGNRYWWTADNQGLILLGSNAFGQSYYGQVNLGTKTNSDWIYVEIDLSVPVTQELYENSNDKNFYITGCNSSTSVGGYYVDNIALK